MVTGIEMEIATHLNTLSTSTMHTKTIFKLEGHKITAMGRDAYIALMQYIKDRVQQYGLWCMSYLDRQGNIEIVINKR